MMLRTLSAFLLISSLVAAAEFPKVRPQVRQQIAAKGETRVITSLNVPRSNKSPGERHEEYNRIKDDLLSELVGTAYKVAHRLEFIPAIAITIGADALAVLERSERVKQISEDKQGKIL
jgi:hypothetical protein